MNKGTPIARANGFASPALGYEDCAIDLNELLIKQPAATYFYRLDSEDMEGLGLPRGALLVVDRSKIAVNNNIVLLRYEGQFLCRLMVKQKGYSTFTNGKNNFLPIVDDTEIIGVVTAFIKECNNDFSH